MSGGRVSRGSLITTLSVYSVVSIVAMTSSIMLGVPEMVIPLYCATLLCSAFLTIRWVDKKIILWRGDDGLVWAKGGNLPYILWFGGFLSRIIMGYIFIGPDMISNMFTIHKSLGTAGLDALVISDVVLMVGVGALGGRNMLIMSRLKAFK
ncbi:MAG: hypothetical protein KGI33_10445 [Thaumarchaeota archaeon]|nr:hypothetical protein [Nitrososphaerota archaeon]